MEIKCMSLSGAGWENTAACFCFTLLMTVSHGGIKKSWIIKRVSPIHSLSAVHHCDSRATASRLLQEVIPLLSCWLIVCAKGASFSTWGLPTWAHGTVLCRPAKASLGSVVLLLLQLELGHLLGNLGSIAVWCMNYKLLEKCHKTTKPSWMLIIYLVPLHFNILIYMNWPPAKTHHFQILS